MLEIESNAAKLESYFSKTTRHDLQLVCGLRFFSKHRVLPPSTLEPYVRQFIHRLKVVASVVDPWELLPEEIEQLQTLVSDINQNHAHTVGSVEPFTALLRKNEKYNSAIAIFKSGRSGVVIPCLFVEDNPSLDLPKRGRILYLQVKAIRISKEVEQDEIFVLHDHAKASPEFQEQAVDSVKASRMYLAGRFSLSQERRYRIEFRLADNAPIFTGDSLGVAFAVGAVIAISQRELFRSQMTLAPGAAFTGALASDGTIKTIGVEGLQFKLHRAVYSTLATVALPNEHFEQVTQFMSSERELKDGHLFKAVFVDDLIEVMESSRFVTKSEIPLLKWLWLKAWAAKRSLWVEIPALAVLLGIFIYLVLPFLAKTPARVCFVSNGFELVNPFDRVVWAKTFPGAVLDTTETSFKEWHKIADLDGDGAPEVIVLIPSKLPDSLNGKLVVYSADDSLLFTRFCGITRELPFDTIPEGKPDLYEANHVHVKVVNGETRIITEIFKSGRSYIRIFGNQGEDIGWYINLGGTELRGIVDANRDGREDFLFFGFNNPLGCVALFVLPAESPMGVGPPYDWISNDPSASIEKRSNHIAYFAFPPTDIWKKDPRQEYQSGMDIDIGLQGLIAKPHEAHDYGGHPLMVHYQITPEFQVSSASLDDPLRTLRSRMIADSIIADIPESTYCNRLRDNVIRYVPK